MKVKETGKERGENQEENEFRVSPYTRAVGICISFLAERDEMNFCPSR